MLQSIFWLLLAILLTLTGIRHALTDPARPVADPAPEELVHLLEERKLTDIRGVNYVRPGNADPESCPDLQFGQDSNCPWDIETIAADMDRLKAHGVNTLRIFLNYYTFGGARLTNPDYTIDAALAHLDGFLDEAGQRGISVMPILMAKYPQAHGFRPDYYDTVLDVHIRPVVRHLAGRPEIIAWDLFNEPDIGSPIDQRCWDWSNGDFPLCFELANERLHFFRAIVAEVRELDPERPLTVSMAFAKNYFEPPDTDLRMAELVDFFSFHYYDNDPYDSGRYEAHWYYGQGFSADLEYAIGELRALDPDKPIVLTELGFPSGPDTLRSHAAFRRDIALAFDITHQRHDCGLILWPFQPRPEDLIGDLFK